MTQLAPSNSTSDEFLQELSNHMYNDDSFENSDARRVFDIAIQAAEWTEDDDRVGELETEVEEVETIVASGVELVGLIQTALDDDGTREDLVESIKELINDSDF